MTAHRVQSRRGQNQSPMVKDLPPERKPLIVMPALPWLIRQPGCARFWAAGWGAWRPRRPRTPLAMFKSNGAVWDRGLAPARKNYRSRAAVLGLNLEVWWQSQFLTRPPPSPAPLERRRGRPTHLGPIRETRYEVPGLLQLPQVLIGLKGKERKGLPPRARGFNDHGAVKLHGRGVARDTEVPQGAQA